MPVKIYIKRQVRGRVRERGGRGRERERVKYHSGCERLTVRVLR